MKPFKYFKNLVGIFCFKPDTIVFKINADIGFVFITVSRNFFFIRYGSADINTRRYILTDKF